MRLSLISEEKEWLGSLSKDSPPATVMTAKGPNSAGYAEHLHGNHVIWFKKHARPVEGEDVCIQERRLEASHDTKEKQTT